jgi:hypothetical protein
MQFRIELRRSFIEWQWHHLCVWDNWEQDTKGMWSKQRGGVQVCAEGQVTYISACHALADHAIILSPGVLSCFKSTVPNFKLRMQMIPGGLGLYAISLPRADSSCSMEFECMEGWSGCQSVMKLATCLICTHTCVQQQTFIDISMRRIPSFKEDYKNQSKASFADLEL